MYLQWAASAENIYLPLKEVGLFSRAPNFSLELLAMLVVSTSRKSFHKPYPKKSEKSKSGKSGISPVQLQLTPHSIFNQQTCFY
jgi:hypothetical protein